MHTVTEKPNDAGTNDVNAEEDPYFLKIIDEAAKEPYKKYEFPMTEAQNNLIVLHSLLKLSLSASRTAHKSVTFPDEDVPFSSLDQN